MRATHSIKINGKWFKAGEELPALNSSKDPEVKTQDTEEKKSYKKSDIFRMPTAELQALAESEGIENATELTGSELKTILVKHFNL